jgi:TRAP-type C4-dicarboxylate transport system substrate-binding protein
MRKFKNALFVFIAISSFVLAGVSNAQTIKWDMPNEYPPSSIHGENDAFFSKVLKEKTGGKIEITHHYGASLGYKSKDQFDAVSDGAVPIADTFMGPLRGVDPIFLLSSLPFLAKTIDEAKLLWAVSMPYYEKVLNKSNQILLFASPWPPSGLWAKKIIRNKPDVINLKIRTYDPNGTITFKNIGAAPIQLSWSDVVPQLGTGGIDAVLTSAEGGVSSKFWDLLSHFSEINYCAPLNMIHMNAKVFSSLPPELQKAVKEAATETNNHAWEAVKARVQQNYSDMKAHKMTIITDVNPSFLDELELSGKPAIEEWLGKMGPDGKQILDEFKKRLKK